MEDTKDKDVDNVLRVIREEIKLSIQDGELLLENPDSLVNWCLREIEDVCEPRSPTVAGLDAAAQAIEHIQRDVDEIGECVSAASIKVEEAIRLFWMKKKEQKES